MNRLAAQSLAVLVIAALAAFVALRDGERANASLLRGRTGELSSRDKTIDATARHLEDEMFVDDDSVDFVYQAYYDVNGQDDDNVSALVFQKLQYNTGMPRKKHRITVSNLFTYLLLLFNIKLIG